MLKEQELVLSSTQRAVQIFKASQGKIRPHFILTGPSGCGKSHLTQYLAEREELHFIEINAAQLTREGTSGNSLSKALNTAASSNPSRSKIPMSDINQVRQVLMNELGLTRQSIRQLVEEIVLQTVNKKLQELDLDRKIQQSIDSHLGQALRGYRGSAEHLRREIVERLSAAIAQKIRESVTVQFSDPVEGQNHHG